MSSDPDYVKANWNQGDTLNASDFNVLAGTVNETIDEVTILEDEDDRAITNFANAKMWRFKASMAKSYGLLNRSVHLFIGDSMSVPYTGASFEYGASWIERLKARLVRDGHKDGSSGYQCPINANGGQNPLWSLTASWNTVNNNFIQSTAVGAQATLTTTVVGTNVDVWYSNQSAKFTVQIDNGTAVEVVPNGAATLGTYTVTGLSNATHVIRIVATFSPTIIFGAQVRANTGVQFHNLSVYGQTAQGFLANNSFIRTLAANAFPNPDVVHIVLGNNDRTNGRTQAQVLADVATIRSIWPNSSAVYYAQPLTELSVLTDATWKSYVDNLRANVEVSGDGLIDFSARYSTVANFAAMGFLGADNKHPNAAAQYDFGHIAYKAFREAAVV